MTIKDLLYRQGFTIAGARRRLRAGEPPRDSFLSRLREEVEELLRLVDE